MKVKRILKFPTNAFKPHIFLCISSLHIYGYYIIIFLSITYLKKMGGGGSILGYDYRPTPFSFLHYTKSILSLTLSIMSSEAGLSSPFCLSILAT